MAALHRAIPFTEVNGVAVVVGQYLNFHMARMLQVFFHIHDRVAERGVGLAAGQVDGGQQRRFTVHDAHAAPAAAAGGLDDNRIADPARQSEGFLIVIAQGAVGPWNARYSGIFHRLDRRNLVAHQANGVGLWSDENKAALLDPFGEIGVLGQKPVAGMDCHRVGDFGGADQRRHVQITFSGGRRADADRLIGQPHML